jgi:hypothetical protein
MSLGERPVALEARHMGRNRHYAPDPGGRRPREHVGKVLCKLREIEMAMAVDEHERAAGYGCGGP